MHLVSDTVEWDAAMAQARNDRDEARQALGVRGAVIVYEQLRARRRIEPGCPQRDLEIARSQYLVERTMGEAVRLVWIERLVDHVPHVDRAAEVLYFRHDVVLYSLRQQAHVRG